MNATLETGAITSFRGDNLFLSNYDQHEPFKWRGDYFTSGEQAFAFAKGYFSILTGPAQQAYFDSVLNAETPGEAKGLGRKVPLTVDNWDSVKVQYMREITSAKFSGVPEYAGKLMNTGARMLVEGNTWGDKFWGRCKVGDKWVGLNTLGVILMEQRGRWLHQAPNGHKPLDF